MLPRDSPGDDSSWRSEILEASNTQAPPPPAVHTFACHETDEFNNMEKFVKYLDGEVERLEKVEKDIAEKKRKQKESAEKDKMPMGATGNEVLNVIRIVRTRVCAQLDLMMGEDVAVLTRMLSYDDRFMMRAALRTGKRPSGLVASPPHY